MPVQWPLNYDIKTTVALNNGTKMPIFGLGTWLAEHGKTGEAVKEAIKKGYIHIDCASIYENEDEVGDALQEIFKEGKVKREDIFITSKLWNDCHRKEHVKEACLKTLKDLKLDYLDLYLIHFPVSFVHGIKEAKSSSQMENPQIPLEETWDAMEQLVKDGLVRAIGVSNFEIEHLEQIKKLGGTVPAANQFETQPYLQKLELVQYCNEEGTVVTAHTSLGSGGNPWAAGRPALLDDETIQKLAKKYNKTPAQVLLRWGLQRATQVIPKSIHAERIAENAAIFDFHLTEEDMKEVKHLDRDFRFNHPTTAWLGRGPFPDDK